MRKWFVVLVLAVGVLIGEYRPPVLTTTAIIEVYEGEDIPWDALAFDHAVVLKDYMEWQKGKFEGL